MTRAESLVWKESPELVKVYACLLKASFQYDLTFNKVAEVMYIEELG